MNCFGMSKQVRCTKITDTLYVASSQWVEDHVVAPGKKLTESVTAYRSRKQFDPKKLDLPFEGIINAAWNIRLSYPLYMPVLQLGIDDHDYVDRKIYRLAYEFYKTVGSCLVHCNAGLNRSAAVAAALLIGGGCSYDNALSTVQSPLQYEISKELKFSLKQFEGEG
ncbi:MAG: dual specificity protein phosphatase family protein [Candidatus Riesia sp.]|nr:dual specificity protein phosphatase family protein [Candidatus Riesia sp.]